MRFTPARYASPLLLTACGAISVFAYAPVNAFALMWLALAALFLVAGKAENPKQAALLGYVWGLGYFCANIYWIFISLHTFGGMPAWMAAGCVFLLAVYLAIFPALGAWLGHKLGNTRCIRVGLTLPTAFVLTEWLRGWLFTGFPWATVGTSQLPMTPMAGYAPILGVYGISLILALSLGVIAALPRNPKAWGAVAFTWLAGWGLTHVEWTQPIGKPVTVSLVQGAIPQDEKWAQEHYLDNLRIYLRLTRQAKGEIVILPETAIPSFLSDTPDWYLYYLRAAVAPRALVTGVPLTGQHVEEYYNSVMFLTDPKMPTYSKHHLVPFGEFVPLPWLFGWMYHYLNMPLSGFTPGGTKQAAFAIGPTTRLAANICYEDVYGREIIHALPEATLLVNVSNLAWFDGSWAAWQQTQMSQARALETGRMMLRATNTGMTAIIDNHGKLVSVLAEGKRGILEGSARNYVGMTPYARFSDWLALGLGGLLLVLARFLRRKH
ncbi:apolipoprotein N-acyltransferase [Silvimonas sp.]|uniref:apolipoprotein N-acyltransferase n=1 Tax=Silvimonas sp. TaxID=2650811 RepID=UPI00283DBD9C|nr:apolipoprotein N-acyltransferase [Silvimonas sp.]MDR3427604.1 apolipoprotein N-acyltransferase [Silvimonas sp.]